MQVWKSSASITTCRSLYPTRISILRPRVATPSELLYPPSHQNMMTSAGPAGRSIRFGRFDVSKQVFLTTQHSFGLVNLKPLIAGHVLVCPLKPHLRLTDLSPEETADLFSTVKQVQRLLARKYFPDPKNITSGSFTVAVQDGPDSGQTVPHVHVHVIPRVRTDESGEPDEIYERMASEEGNIGGALWDRKRPVPGGAMPRIEDADRKGRTDEEMQREAEEYETLLKDMGV